MKTLEQGRKSNLSNLQRSQSIARLNHETVLVDDESCLHYLQENHTSNSRSLILTGNIFTLIDIQGQHFFPILLLSNYLKHNIQKH